MSSLSRLPGEILLPPTVVPGATVPPRDGAGAGCASVFTGWRISARVARLPAIRCSARTAACGDWPEPGHHARAAWREASADLVASPYMGRTLRRARGAGKACQHHVMRRFLPPLLLMALIFFFSAQPDLNSGL